MKPEVGTATIPWSDVERVVYLFNDDHPPAFTLFCLSQRRPCSAASAPQQVHEPHSAFSLSFSAACRVSLGESGLRPSLPKSCVHRPAVVVQSVESRRCLALNPSRSGLCVSNADSRRRARRRGSIVEVWLVHVIISRRGFGWLLSIAVSSCGWITPRR